MGSSLYLLPSARPDTAFIRLAWRGAGLTQAAQSTFRPQSATHAGHTMTAATQNVTGEGQAVTRFLTYVHFSLGPSAGSPSVPGRRRDGVAAGPARSGATGTSAAAA